MQPGDIISSRYRVEQILSVRGISKRCIGQRIHDGERVIIETLHESLTNDDVAMNAIRYEVELAERLNEPYFMGVIDSFTTDGLFYIIWRYVDATPLTRNSSLVELSTNQIMVLIADIVKALDIAHKKGVVHGALSTDAILVTPELEPIIIDFAVPGVELTTDPGVEGGISVYRACAPELFHGEALDASCDFYALGVIAQFLLSNADEQRQIETQKMGAQSAVRSKETPVLLRARTLIGSLTSSHREIRRDCAGRILDPTFLDAMVTPPQGHEIVSVNRKQARSVKRLYKTQTNQTDYSVSKIDIAIKALFITGVAIAVLVILAKLVS